MKQELLSSTYLGTNLIQLTIIICMDIIYTTRKTTRSESNVYDTLIDVTRTTLDTDYSLTIYGKISVGRHCTSSLKNL